MDRLVHHHPGDCFAIFLLLRRVYPMRFQIHCKAMHRMLDAKIFKLAVMVRIILLKR